jgi:hypothetical protein
VSTPGRSIGAVATTALLATTVLLASSGDAQAAACRLVVQVQNSVPVGIQLSPRQSSVPYGGCVQFSDQAFGPPVTITVAGGYHVTLNYGESTAGKTNYAANAPGAHGVTADTGTNSASGQITVGPAPTHAPSPSRSPSASPHPTPAPAGSQSSGPEVAPTPRQHHRRGSLAIPTGKPPTHAGTSPTPGAAPSVAGSPPGPLQTTTPAATVAGGPLEPPTGRALGLPAALAALVLIGVGTAMVRVVLAEPAVDNGRSVGGTA